METTVIPESTIRHIVRDEIRSAQCREYYLNLVAGLWNQHQQNDQLQTMIKHRVYKALGTQTGLTATLEAHKRSIQTMIEEERTYLNSCRQAEVDCAAREIEQRGQQIATQYLVSGEGNQFVQRVAHDNHKWLSATLCFSVAAAFIGGFTGVLLLSRRAPGSS